MAQPPKIDFTQNQLAYSYANNNSPSNTVHEERARYEDDIFPATMQGTFFDFWGRDKLYGRVNTKGNVVVVRETNLKQLKYSDSESPVYALNFVADAWRDFLDRVKKDMDLGRLFQSGPYYEMRAKKGWRSIDSSYHTYMTDTLYPVFSDVFLDQQRNKAEQVRDIDSFLRVFTDFSRVSLKFGGPMTLSGFTESIYCSPLNTGLVIEVSEDPHDADFDKIQSYLYDSNFEPIVDIASQYGFAIDKNAPWRFVADLRSPAMREYMFGVNTENIELPPNLLDDCGEPINLDIDLPEPYGFSTIQGFTDLIRHAPGYSQYENIKLDSKEEVVYRKMFQSAFTEIWSIDMDILRLYLIDFYNSIVKQKPTICKPRTFSNFLTNLRCGSENFEDELITRSQVNSSLFNSQVGVYRDKWNLKCYYILRVLERALNKNKIDVKKDIRKMIDVYDHGVGNLDYNYLLSLKYMQDQFIMPIGVNPPLRPQMT